MTDNVNHPAHYEGSTSIECIEAMVMTFGPEAVANFCLCNAYKYLWRHKNKNGLEDLQKAKWYINKAMELDGRYGEHLYFDMDKLVTINFYVIEKEEAWLASEHTSDNTN